MQAEQQPAYYSVPRFIPGHKVQLANMYPSVGGRITGEDSYDIGDIPLEERKGSLFFLEAKPELKEFIQRTSQELGRSVRTIEGMLVQLGAEIGLPSQVLGGEVQIYPGVMHGFNTDFAYKVRRLRPDGAFFTHITGSDEGFERHKRAFYEFVNPAKPYAEKQDVADTFILNLPLEHNPDRTVMQGYIDFLNMRFDLEEIDLSTRERIIADLLKNPEIIAADVRRLASSTHRNHGREVAERWSQTGRINVLKAIHRDTVAGMDFILKPMMEKGANVVVYVDNLSDSRSMEVISGKEGDKVAVPFDTREELKKRGIPYFDEITPIRSKDGNVTVVVPFFTALRERTMDGLREEVDATLDEVRDVRKNGGKVVIAAVGSPHWKEMDLSVQNPETSKSNKNGANTIRQLTHLIKPDVVVPVHLPDQRRDERQKEVDDNAHWLIDNDQEEAPVVRLGEEFGPANTSVEVVVPSRKIGVVVFERRRRILPTVI